MRFTSQHQSCSVHTINKINHQHQSGGQEISTSFTEVWFVYFSNSLQSTPAVSWHHNQCCDYSKRLSDMNDYKPLISMPWYTISMPWFTLEPSYIKQNGWHYQNDLSTKTSKKVLKRTPNKDGNWPLTLYCHDVAWKQPIKVPNLKPLSFLPPLPHWHVKRIFIKTYSTGNKWAVGPASVLFKVTCVHLWARKVYILAQWSSFLIQHKVACKLQALVYDILLSTTAVFSYAIGSTKLSANEQFFVGVQTVVSLLQTTQNKVCHL